MHVDDIQVDQSMKLLRPKPEPKIHNYIIKFLGDNWFGFPCHKHSALEDDSAEFSRGSGEISDSVIFKHGDFIFVYLK
jgi:hypothetical protein